MCNRVRWALIPPRRAQALDQAAALPPALLAAFDDGWAACAPQSYKHALRGGMHRNGPFKDCAVFLFASWPLSSGIVTACAEFIDFRFSSLGFQLTDLDGPWSCL